MRFEQVDSTTFTTSFEGVDDMGKNAVKGISFFNDTFDVLVKEINCEWDTKKITFVIRTANYIRREVDTRLRESTNYVAWKVKQFKIQWKQKRTAESYHNAVSVGELEQEYKNKTASLCNEKDSDWEIDKIVSG